MDTYRLLWQIPPCYDNIILTLEYACLCVCVSVTKRPHLTHYPQANTLSTHTWPERPKGAKDKVKQARRAQSRPEGPQARSRGPRLLV